MTSVLSPSLWPQTIHTVAKIVQARGGRAFLVGGCVRDALWQLPVKDFDLEIYGIPAADLESLLAKHFTVLTVGKSFGVLKLRDFPLDLSLPRRERKSGPGHKGFDVGGDPFMSPEEAVRRRDFTLNAILCDPLSGQLVDPLDGQGDLQRRILRHCSDHFAEDPLRVLRAMQMAARFLCTVHPETVEFCRPLRMEELPAERIWEEWKKLILLGRKPSLGLQFLRDCGWIRYFPELERLIGCPQHAGWHPEGDVWTHTGHCLDAFARERSQIEEEDLIVGLAVLCHDLGKPSTTVRGDDGIWRSPEHDIAGAEPTLAFLRRLTRETSLLEAVLPLVIHHMRPLQLYEQRAGDAAIRRLARQVGRIDRLLRVVSADLQGRPPLGWDRSCLDWLQEKSAALAIKDQAPRPILLGRHLIAAGLPPGPRFKAILEACFEAQLEGIITDEASGLAFLQKHLSQFVEPKTVPPASIREEK